MLQDELDTSHLSVVIGHCVTMYKDNLQGDNTISLLELTLNISVIVLFLEIYISKPVGWQTLNAELAC